MRHFFTSCILLFSFSLLQAQIADHEMINMSLHISVTDAKTGEKNTQNYHNAAAQAFDIPAFISAQSAEDHVQIFGTKRQGLEIEGYRFDSKKLTGTSACSDLCEKVIQIERVPYMGLAVTAKDDFSGVTIEDVIGQTTSEDDLLQEGDVITAIQAYDITNPCELTSVISDQEVDGILEVEIIRDGQPIRDYVKMGSRVKKTITWVNCCPPETAAADLGSKARQLQVFPNPTPDWAQFVFSSTSISRAALQVTDITGLVLFEKTLTPVDGGVRDYLDFGQFASGIYLVRIEQDGQQIVERVIVQRK